MPRTQADNRVALADHLGRGLSVVTKPFAMDALARKIAELMAERLEPL